jgi:hypothetical protein
MNLVILVKPKVLSNFPLKITIAVQLVLGNIDLFTLFHLLIIGIAGNKNLISHVFFGFINILFSVLIGLFLI